MYPTAQLRLAGALESGWVDPPQPHLPCITRHGSCPGAGTSSWQVTHIQGIYLRHPARAPRSIPQLTSPNETLPAIHLHRAGHQSFGPAKYEWVNRSLWCPIGYRELANAMPERRTASGSASVTDCHLRQHHSRIIPRRSLANLLHRPRWGSRMEGVCSSRSYLGEIF